MVSSTRAIVNLRAVDSNTCHPLLDSTLASRVEWPKWMDFSPYRAQTTAEPLVSATPSRRYHI